MDDFQEFVSSTPNFQVSFIEGRSTQQWMVAREDLSTVYASAKDDEITLWYDKLIYWSRLLTVVKTRILTLKMEPQHRRLQKLMSEQILQIVDQLASKHSESYTVPLGLSISSQSEMIAMTIHLTYP